MAKSPNALELLRRDHREVLQMLRQFERTDDTRQQQALSREIVAELDKHSALEEDVFYPYVRDTSDRLELIEEAFIEHDSTRELMDELRGEDAGSPRFQALMKVLGEYVAMHVREEEERIFPLVEKMGIDLDALGEELAEHRGNGDGRDHGRHAGERRADGRKAAAHPHHAEHHAAHGGEHPGHKAGHGPAHKEHPRAHEAEHARPHKAEHAPPHKGEHPRPHKGEGHGHDHDAVDTTRDDKRYLKEHGDELSRSTQHALWIHSVDQHADHDGQTLATRNPDVIRQWAEARGAQPATSPGGDPDNPRVLRFDFPDYDKNLQPVSWEAWLKVFQDRELVFLYQENMKAGNPSNFFRLDSPDREDG